MKIIFNLAKILGHANQHEEAVKYNDMGIKLAINLNTLYLLGELYYGKAWNLLKIKQPNEEDVANNMKKALFIFELTEKENLIKWLKKNILKTKLKKVTHNSFGNHLKYNKTYREISVGFIYKLASKILVLNINF